MQTSLLADEKRLAKGRSMLTNCANLFDVKYWFACLITPDFSTQSARDRMASRDEYDPEPCDRRKAVTRYMQQVSDTFNKDEEYQSVLLPSQDGYVRMGRQTSDTRPRPSLFKRWFSELKPGGLRSTTIALVASALGSGCLALPYAFSLVGVGLGLVTLFLAGMVSALSLQVLMLGARYTGCTTYAGVLELATGTAASSYAMDIILLLNGVGSVICCLIFEGDFVPAVVKAAPFGLGGYVLPREYAIIGAACAVWPLCVPDDISALRYVAIAVPIALITVSSVVVADSYEMHAATQAQGYEISWWQFNFLGWLKATSIFMNAFTNQMNGVQCAEKFVNPSVRRIVKSTWNSSLVAGGLYAVLGVAGYTSFMAATQGDFLLNYPLGRKELWIIRCMLSVIVYVALPVSLLPAAKSGAQLLFRFCRVLGCGKGETGVPKIGPITHAVSATCFLWCCCLVALRTSDVATVINIVGGLLATPIMFFFPAVIFYQLLWPAMPKSTRWFSLIFMVFFGVVGWASVFLNEIWMRL